MILPIIEDDPLPSELYHYTDAGGLKGILEGKQLWATHAAYLNDSEEILYGRNAILSEIKKLGKERPPEIKDAWTASSHWFLKLFGTPTLMAGLTAMIQQRTAALLDNFGPFVTCLSESRDQLSQWRGYGGGGGYAIRFDPAGLHESVVRLSTPLPQPLPGMGPDEVPIGARRFIKMEYDADGQYEFLRQQLFDFVHRSVKYFEDYKDDSEVKKAQAAQLGQETMGWLHGLMMHLKNPGFAEEKEYRILTFFPPDFFSPTDTGLVPRVNIRFDPRCIKEIVIGPGRSMETREASVRYFLNVHNTDYPGVEVTPSKTPFRGN